MGSWRSFFAGVLTVYALVALMTGGAMERAIPAMNALGGLYVGVTWPGAMFCAATIQCSVLPPAGSPLANAMFTFAEPSHV